jgi:hypothetical protein
VNQTSFFIIRLGARLHEALFRRHLVAEAIRALPNTTTASLSSTATAPDELEAAYAPVSPAGSVASVSSGKKPKSERARRATPALDEIFQAQFLTVKLAPLRYPGTSESVWRHRIFKTEPERREAQLEQREPKGLANCFKRQGKRSVVVDCTAYDAYLRSQE